MEEGRDQVDGAGPAPWIGLDLGPAAPPGAHLRWSRLAGLPFAANAPLNALAPFAASSPALPAGGGPLLVPSLPSDLPGEGAVTTYDGLGFVGGRDRVLRASRGASGWLLQAADLGTFGVEASGAALGWLAPSPAGPPLMDELVTTLLGPPLMLALALRGRWCLHGSALLDGEGVIALLGVSGAGKSTLAAHVEERDPGARVADDVLALTLGAQGGATAWPSLPQLKLSGAAQWRGREALPLRAICVLEPDRPDVATVRAEPLAVRAAALAFVRHTVGARLFDAPLAGAHMRAAAMAAEAAPWWRLRVPRRRSALAAAAALLGQLAREPGSTGAGSL
jgi:predicted kinase